ncbi:CD63 antigen [Orchesella cincta]|uniref:CD63 antigen n=1 Tax=Orchesella cincta TaxID=48709 RepID=A0A1D2MNB3_ORCCI|nr:CD63 antigen [Orchesella cincta]
MDADMISETGTETSLPPAEKWVQSEIVKLAREIEDPDNPHQSFKQRLQHLLRIPDHVYDDMLQSVRDVSDQQQSYYKANIKRHRRKERDRELKREEKERFLEKVKRLEDDEVSKFHRCCTWFSRNVVGYFKYFARLSVFLYFLQISPASCALLFWHFTLYLQFAISVGITALEVSISRQTMKSIGEGALELLGHSYGLGISVCVFCFLITLLGWIAARYRFRTLGLVYMVLLALNTTFYLIHTFTENYDNESELIGKAVMHNLREFQENPGKFPYIAKMQIKFACCGGAGPADYFAENADYLNGQMVTLPDSCCLRATSTMRERRGVKCEVKDREPWPLQLNINGCGQAVAEYMIPTQSIKGPLSAALIYVCILSILAVHIFFKNYHVEVNKKIVSEAKLTLGEKLLAALDIHRLNLGESTDATVDVLRHKIGECETIPEVIQAVMEMIDEVEELLHVDPTYLAKLLLGVKNKDLIGDDMIDNRILTVSGPMMTPKNTRPIERETSDSSVYLDQPKVHLMTKSLLKTGTTNQTKLLQRELAFQGVKRSALYLLPENSQVILSSDREFQSDTYYEEKEMEAKWANVNEETDHERLLTEIIKHSQDSVRNMKKRVKYMRPLAFSSPRTHELIPHATKLLQTVDNVRAEEGQRQRSIYDLRPRSNHSHIRINEQPRENHRHLEHSSFPSSVFQDPDRVTGKLLTESQYDIEVMGAGNPMELIKSFNPEQLEQSPGRLDVGLRNAVANMRDTEH